MTIATTTRILLCAAALAAPAAARSGAPDAGHAHSVMVRGDRAMGFSHAKTLHHFRLLPDGGAIEIVANDAADTASRNAIRAHLGLIAERFAAGDFSLPMFIHGAAPPGVPELQSLRGKIRYAYEPAENGGRVRISTRNARALVAIHDFLRFQIRDHGTGDALEVLEQPMR